MVTLHRIKPIGFLDLLKGCLDVKVASKRRIKETDKFLHGIVAGILREMLGQFFVHRQLNGLLVCQSVRCVDTISLIIREKAVVAIRIGGSDKVGVLAIIFGNIALCVFLDERVWLEEASIRLVATLAYSISLHVF